jgi:ATP-dependent Clp protease ATP-binding subunit ClpC
MFKRFTERARRVIILAREEAERYHHEYLGTEHILLGILKDGGGIAITVSNNSSKRWSAISPAASTPWW